MQIEFKHFAARDRDWITAELWDEIERYVMNGIPPSQFVRFVLLNDLNGAANQASPVNMAILGWLARFIFRNVPWPAKYSEAKVNSWGGVDNLSEEDRANFRWG